MNNKKSTDGCSGECICVLRVSMLLIAVRA